MRNDAVGRGSCRKIAVRSGSWIGLGLGPWVWEWIQNLARWTCQELRSEIIGF
ncbi:hypothetical protein JHK82_047011 [Glycine max]|nr:hypothetical protein JHK86_046903 [Glycine max]KAG5097157.1 hypothetical protein JHK82_047011 [Glycine max]KAG5101944.1 hypothetical protein JHK84_046913 [Glycine max]